MAWINDTQYAAALAGASIEHGYVTLTTVLASVEIATRMHTVVAGFASYKTAPDAATSLYCDCTITNGAVTVADATGAAGTDRVINYLFIGR